MRITKTDEFDEGKINANTIKSAYCRLKPVLFKIWILVRLFYGINTSSFTNFINESIHRNQIG